MGDTEYSLLEVEMPFDVVALFPHPLQRIVFLDRLTEPLKSWPWIAGIMYACGGNRLFLRCVLRRLPDFTVMYGRNVLAEDVRAVLRRRRGHLNRFDPVKAVFERYGMETERWTSSGVGGDRPAGVSRREDLPHVSKAEKAEKAGRKPRSRRRVEEKARRVRKRDRRGRSVRV